MPNEPTYEYCQSCIYYKTELPDTGCTKNYYFNRYGECLERKSKCWVIRKIDDLCKTVADILAVWMAVGATICLLTMSTYGGTMNNAFKAQPEEQMIAKILNGIAHVESKDQDIGVHKDGTSHGRYGVTAMAADELIRVGSFLDAHEDTSYNLDDPTTNARVARLYLLLMFERSKGSWWNAVEKYHGSKDQSANQAYAAKVWSYMDEK